MLIVQIEMLKCLLKCFLSSCSSDIEPATSHGAVVSLCIMRLVKSSKELCSIVHVTVAKSLFCAMREMTRLPLLPTWKLGTIARVSFLKLDKVLLSSNIIFIFVFGIDEFCILVRVLVVVIVIFTGTRVRRR